MEYEYVYGRDVFDDDNKGLLWGVESREDFPEYVEWYKSLNELLRKTRGMKIANKEQFLARFRNTHKVTKKGMVKKIPKRMM